MCWIWASEAQFGGHFGPQNKTWFRSLVILSNIFHSFHFLLLLHAYWRCVYVYFKVYTSLQQNLLGQHTFFTVGDFALRILLFPASVCVCLCLCVYLNHEVVDAVSHDPLKLGSQNLEQSSKRDSWKCLFVRGGGGAVWASCGARVGSGVGWWEGVLFS